MTGLYDPAASSNTGEAEADVTDAGMKTLAGFKEM
jgi:hypothetical protein